MTRSNFLETLVGIFVVAVTVLFLIYAYQASGKSLGRDSYLLSAVFGRVDGITSGADVRIAGVQIGSVTEFNLDQQTYEANVSMSIDRGIRIPDDSVAKVVSDGLLGGAHIALEPGASEFYLEDGGTVTITQGSVDLLGVAMQAFTAGSGGGNSGGNNNSDAEGLGNGL